MVKLFGLSTPKTLILDHDICSATIAMASIEPSACLTFNATSSSLSDKAAAMMILLKSRLSLLPAISIISSPAFRPARAAGEPGITPPTTAGVKFMPIRKTIIKTTTAPIALNKTPDATTAIREATGLLANERGSSLVLTGPMSS